MKVKGHYVRRDDAGDDPSPAVGCPADTEADQQSEKDADDTGGHVHQSSALGGVSEVADEGGRVGGNDTTADRKLVCLSALI
jgi:hypothetical protein